MSDASGTNMTKGNTTAAGAVKNMTEYYYNLENSG